MADIHGSPALEAQNPQAGTAGPAPAPYYAGSISPVGSPVNGDADEQDDVAGTVDGAVAAANARWRLAEQDTYQQGSVIGDLMTFPPQALEAGGVGSAPPLGGFYDPPRDYGDDRSGQ